MNPDCLVSEVARELSSQSPWPALSGGFDEGCRLFASYPPPASRRASLECSPAG